MKDVIQMDVSAKEREMILEYREKIAKDKERQENLSKAKAMIEKGIDMFIKNGGFILVYDGYGEEIDIDSWYFSEKKFVLSRY